MMIEPEALATRGEVIAMIHGLHLSLAEKCRIEPGADNEDVAIAALYGALDASTILMRGDKDAGIGWLRAALDVIEAGQSLVAETIQ